MAQYAQFSKPNPQWKRFLESQPTLRGLGESEDDIIHRRGVLQKVAREGPQLRKVPGEDEVTTKDFTITARDGYEIPARSYIPRESTSVDAGTYPVLIYYHGGGFCFGNLETGDENCRLLAVHNRVSVLNVDYRLAPQHPFPKGFEDSHDALRWVAQNASLLSADPTKGFLVGGVSAGANFAGALAYFARDERLQPPITGLLLSIPCCLMPHAFDRVPQWRDELLSLEQNRNADLLDVRSYCQLVEELYQAPPDDPRVSFLLNPDHTGLPPRAYLQVVGLDPIRDEALLFGRLLRDYSGSATRIDLYDGLPHGFWRFQELPASRTWENHLYEGTNFLLRGGQDGVHIRGNENGCNEYFSGLSGWV